MPRLGFVQNTSFKLNEISADCDFAMGRPLDSTDHERKFALGTGFAHDK